MDSPSFTISQSLLKLTSIELWCYLTSSSSVSSFFSSLQSFPTLGSLPRSGLFTSGGQSFRASASASVLPMNIQGWFPLRWTDLISLESKRLSRVFSSPTQTPESFNCTAVPNLSDTRNCFCGRQFFHGWGWGVMIWEWFKCITLIMHLISVIVAPAPPEIIKH